MDFFTIGTEVSSASKQLKLQTLSFDSLYKVIAVSQLIMGFLRRAFTVL